MEDWINDQWYSMSAFLDDYGYEYSSESGSAQGVASELYSGWIEKNSKFDEYPNTVSTVVQVQQIDGM